MKGKNTFTKSEIYDLRNLIKLRVKADRNQQKSIRNKMRNIGFYGKDDFDIIDLQPSDFENLITSGQIKIIGEDLSNDFNSEVKPIQSKNNNSDLSKTPGKEVDMNKFIEFKPLSDNDEEKLSKWMKENLTLFFFKNDNSASNENTLIDKFNPPLNLDKNKNLVNQTFRKELSRLRNIK